MISIRLRDCLHATHASFVGIAPKFLNRETREFWRELAGLITVFDRLPTRQELDEAVPDRPMLLLFGFIGPCATNSLGKKLFDTADAAPSVHPPSRRLRWLTTDRSRQPSLEKAAPSATR